MHSVTRFLITFLFIVLLFSIDHFAQAEIPPLEPGKPIKRELKGGEIHSYPLRLAANQFVHFATNRRGIDITVKLIAPDGQTIIDENALTGVSYWLHVTDKEGEYRIEIGTLHKAAKPEEYQIAIFEVRQAVSTDTDKVKAWRILLEALKLRYQEKAFDAAIAKYESAAEIYRRIVDLEGEASTLSFIGEVYGNELRNNKMAITYFEKMSVVAERIDNKAWLAGALANIGHNYVWLDNYRTSRLYYERAFSVFEKLGNKPNMWRMMDLIGNGYRQQGDLKQSIKYHHKALEIAETIPQFRGIDTTLHRLGMVYSEEGNYSKALFYDFKTLEYREKYGDKLGIATILMNIGNVYQQLGNLELALVYFQKSLDTFEELRNNTDTLGSGQGTAFLNIGNTYILLDKYVEAKKTLQEALNIFQRDKLAQRMASTLLSFGKLYHKQKDYSLALESLYRSLEISKNLSDKRDYAATLNEISGVYLSQGKFVEAIDNAEQSAKIYKEAGALNEFWKSKLNEGKAYNGLKQPEQAHHTFDEAIETIETLLSQAGAKEQEQQSFFATKTLPYYEVVNLLVEQDKSEEAFKYAERGKSRTLLDVLQNGKIDFLREMTAQEKEQESNLKRELVSLNVDISKENQKQQPDKVRLTDLRSQLQKKRLEFEDFQTRLYAARPELKVQRGEMKPVSLEESAKLLPDDKSALLEYVVLDDKAFLFVLTKEAKQSQASLKVYLIEVKQKDLAERTESFRSKLAKGDLDFSKQAQDLYNLLLKPAEARIKNKTNLIIVPDSVLWDLPFQALQPAQNKYLIETKAVAYAPSLTALREMRKKNQSRQFSNATLLAFGNPTVGKETTDRIKQVFMSEKLEPLPEAERLVNSLRQMYGENRSKVFVGAQAREEIAKTESPKYRVVQFAAHGILNDASPMYSHIVLAQRQDNPAEDGLLEAWEMKDLDLNADIVILSSCETARGRFSSGEGVIGMSWALFIAGAPTTVASQWKVESSSTTDLMLEFHRQLLTGKRISKAEALRQASLKLLRMPKYKHPSYWAGFVIVGDGF